jgi:S-DNA-T family DNA segregation ATPase FtsK/SpoIIIE
MPVTITVSEVRRALYLAAGAQSAGGDGSPSVGVLGQWFHDAIGWLVEERQGVNTLAILADVDEDLEIWKQTLVTRAYSQFVGPRLTAHHAAFHDLAPQVLSFWKAMQAACQWLAELAWSVRPPRATRTGSRPAPWETLAEWLSTEEPLSCELKEPGWSDSVKLIGIADAIIRLKGLTTSGGSMRHQAWCAIEFKLGQTSPAADLGQACLYHLMLSAANEQSASPGAEHSVADDGMLALISFRPERHEQLFDAASLASARPRLVDLIGKLAGVDSTQIVAPLGKTGPVHPLPAVPKSNVPQFTRPTAEHLRLGEELVGTLTTEYDIAVSLDGPPIVGPTFLRFPIKLGRKMKVAAVQRRVEELQLRLRLKRAPFIAIEEGSFVIDIQRPDPQMVMFDDIRAQLPASDPKLGGSHVPIGVDITGHLVCANLAKTEHSHLLAAGTTGSGKSEWLRTAIAGLMVTNTPDTLRLLIIDPKRNAFHALRKSPYLWKPLVFPDEQSTAEVLQELATEMDRRYRQLDGADSHAQLVARSDVPLPRIVCVCDEYRDLISRSREERKLIEDQICRLGAKARAAGIHLILATQEPRRETIKGPLDSNIPARVGLWMQKAQESRMLLSEAGAEKLLGNGDLLFKDVGPPRRLQAPLLTEENRNAIFGA